MKGNFSVHIKIGENKMENLKVENADIKSIQSYKFNPKIHQEKQIQQIANSIDRFGFNNPILVDEKFEIIAGHGRFAAAQLLKLEQVPIIRLLHLSEVEKRAYRIADNKLSDNSQWDIDLLKLEFSEIEKLALDLDDELTLDITGFDFKDIDVIMDEPKPKDVADDKLINIPYVPENEVVCERGDVWLLGKHKVICGDSLEKATFEALFGDVKAGMVFADPPYNVKVANIVGQGKIKHQEFAMASGEMSETEFINFIKT